MKGCYNTEFRIARLRAGVTQTELAEKIGVSTASISHWETGRHSPKSGDIVKLADALNVPAESIVRMFA